MPRPIRMIEIYLPLDYNDGSAIEEAKFVNLQQQLMARFGGVTSIQRHFPLQGLWQFEEEVFEDRVTVFTVLDFRTQTDFEIIRYLERLKASLKKRFEQLDVLITLQDMLAI